MNLEKDITEKEDLTLEDKIEIYEETLQKVSLNSDKDISKIPLLSKEEEVEIAKKIEEGQEHYKGYLFAANLRLVRKIADEISFKTSRYHNFGEKDLEQEGYCGLTIAVKKFDYKLGYKFSTYATYWIKQSIIRAIEDNGKNIRYPYHYYVNHNKLAQTKETLSSKLGRIPNNKEIANEMNIVEQSVFLSNKRAEQSFVSLEKSLSNENDDSTLKNLLEDPNPINPEDVLKNIDYKETLKILDNLQERERKILEKRFGLNGYERMTLEELGKEYNISRERIRTIQDRAIKRLRWIIIRQNSSIINNIINTLPENEKFALELRLGLKKPVRNGRKKELQNTTDKILEVEKKILKELSTHHIFE